MATIETSCKTAEQTKTDYMEIIKKFGIVNNIKTITTDSGGGIKQAFQYRSDTFWYPCAAHNMNLVLKHAFTIKESDKDYDKVIDVDTLITSSKSLVTHKTIWS